MNLQKRLEQAKLSLLTRKDMTFLCNLMSQLKIVFAEDLPTAATDGIKIWLNPGFVESISNKEFTGLLAHELYHVMFDHINRVSVYGLNKHVWNSAGDYLINLLITGQGMQIPKDGLLDPQFRGMSTREIYDKIIQDPPPNTMEDLIFEVSDEKVDPATADEIRKNILIKAAIATKIQIGSYGDIPDDLRKQLESWLDPKLPWNVILANYMSRYAKDDFSWRKPNKRYLPNFYLPSLYSEALGPIFSFIDVSGSIEQEQLDRFVTEVTDLWNTLHPERLKLFSFNTKITWEQEFVPGEDLKLDMIGDGGTSLKEVIKIIERDAPVVALIFTDGEVDVPDLSHLETDIIFIIEGNEEFTANYATVIHT
jgi:predicted metal-dependent peptidase